MPTARWLSLIAVLPINEIMVIGGSIKELDHGIDTIEIVNFTLDY